TMDLVLGLWIVESSLYSGLHDPMPEVFAALSALPAPAGDDPRIDYWRGRVAAHMGRYEEAEAHLERARRRAQEQGLDRVALLADLSSVGETWAEDAIERMPDLDRLAEFAAGSRDPAPTPA
ncbi:MAG: tetratricopeptide repeat protein, partial [Planctomycetota bacterium]